MLRYLIIFLLVSIGSVFFSFYNKKYEETLPITTGAIIIYLYITYIFNFLHIGYYILIGLISIIYIFCIYKFIKEKEKKKIIKNIFTPGFFIFIICFIIIIFIVSGNKVLLWDELRLWGAYPKILFYDGSLQLGDKVKLLNTMQSYEPGMPLFQYFFTKSTNHFIESDLFLAYALLGIIPLITFTKKLSYKKWYYIPVFILLFILLPLSFNQLTGYDNMIYYHTLFIEPILTIFFSYTMYLSIQDNKDKIDYTTYILSLCTLVLLKDTGIMFALTSIISYLIIHRKEWNKKAITKIICLFSCVLLFMSWKGVQKLYPTENLYSSTIKSNEIITFITGMDDNQKQIIKDFHKEALKKNFDSNFDQLERFLNFYTTSLLILLALGYIVYYKNKKEKEKYLISSICYIVGSIIYIIGTLMLYLFSLHTVASFQRYSSVVTISGLFFIVMLLIEILLNNEKNYTPLIIFTGLFLLLATPLKTPYINNEFYQAAETSEYYSDMIKNNISKNDKFIIAFGQSTSEKFEGVIFHHHIYMNLLDEGFSYPQDIILTEDKTTYNKLLNNYDYIYFIIVNEEDKEQFSTITKIEIKESTLFKVINKERLEKVE